MAEEHIDSVQQDEGTGTETPAAAGGSNDLTFDQWLENNPAFRSEFDRRMTKGVQTAQQRWQREQDESQDEAAKLARMTAAQRERYQLDKDKASFAQQMATFQRQQLEVQVGQDLQKRGMDAAFAPWITGKDAAESAERLDAFEKLWNAGITAAVAGRMRSGEVPKAPASNAAVTRDTLQGMSVQEINKAFESGQLDALMGKK
jgi:hypothetical protein